MPNYFFFENEHFDCTKFVSMMYSIYSCFYDDWSGDEDAYMALVKQGDNLIKNKALKPLLDAYVKEEGDYISSDRECAAFAATFNIYAAA